MNKKLLINIILILVVAGFGINYYLKNKNRNSINLSPAGLVKISENSSLGKYLTDQGGMTLYVFRDDETQFGPIQSNCRDACAEIWPPFLLQENKNLASDKISVFERSPGVFQYTFERQPFYYYSGDKNPGDANGQEITDWSAVLVSR